LSLRLRRAPARRSSRAGAFLLALASVGAGCDRAGPDGDRLIELTHDTIRLADSVVLHEVTVSRQATGEFEPAVLQVTAGDVVRFRAGDRGGHAILFDGGALEPEVREYLERTGQMRSPPLITVDAAWVITLDAAPAGEYRFRCATHDVAGSMTVTAR
jgi:plastocyanin